MAFRSLRPVQSFRRFIFKQNLSTLNSNSKGLINNQNFILLRHCSSQAHIVQMRGLDYDTTEDDVINFFKPLGLIPKKVHLKCDGGGRTAGNSEIEFHTHAEAVVAMRKKNAFIGNKFIRLTLKSEAEIKPVKSPEEQKLESSAKASLNIETRSEASSTAGGHFLRMKNMPWRTTDQAIYDFFWPVGTHAVSVKPVYNESGLRIGEFDVQFLSQEDLRKAMAKNNTYFGTKFVELSRKCS